MGEGSLKNTCFFFGTGIQSPGPSGDEVLGCNCRCSKSTASGEVMNRCLKSWRRATREGVFSMRSINLSANLAQVLRGGSR